METAALTLGSAVPFASFFQFNSWLFSDFLYGDGISWVFLPAGFRIILIVVLGLPGAAGIMLGSWYLDRAVLDSSFFWCWPTGWFQGSPPCW